MLSYYAWTLPHAIFISAYFLALSHLHLPYSPLVSRIWEGPDWVCFGEAQSIPSVSSSSDPSAEPLVLHLTCPPRNMVDLRSTVGGRQYRGIRKRRKASRRRLLSIGSMSEMARH